MGNNDKRKRSGKGKKNDKKKAPKNDPKRKRIIRYSSSSDSDGR